MSVVDSLTFPRQRRAMADRISPRTALHAVPDTDPGADHTTDTGTDLAAPRALRSIDIRTSGDPLDVHALGSFIKPGELVDIVEVTPLNRNDQVLYNQLLAHSWEEIADGGVHRVRKSVLRGSHDSNDRLHASFDTLMGAWAKIKYRDKRTGEKRIGRVHLLGANSEQEEEEGFFYYRWPPELIAIIANSRSWARLKSHIMYSLRSKYSIRLYELIEKRINLELQSESFEVNELRARLGVAKGVLPRFADFNKHCLKPSLAEVNQMTDFTVSAALIKQGRSVVKIRLMWFAKEGEALRAAEEERERHRAGRSVRGQQTVEIIAP